MPKLSNADRKSYGHICFSGDWEFFEVAGEVYRAPRSAPLADLSGPRPRRHGRWESSRAHFDRFRAHVAPDCAPVAPGRAMRERGIHPAAYLPVNIGERTRFEAHGRRFLVGYHSRNTYWLSTDPPGERRRWGTRRQIVEDIGYVLENGALPPPSGSMWESSHPAEPAGHRVADFNTLDDLIAHASRELGATHVLVDGANTRIYFPRGGQYPYEEARVQRRAGYWHAEGPQARRGVVRPPREAETIESYLAGFRPGHAAESPAAIGFGTDERTLTMADVERILGADHVAWILRQKYPDLVAETRASGMWQANVGDAYVAYLALARMVREGMAHGVEPE